MTEYGVDYSWSRPPADALAQLGVTTVLRYVSNDPSKDLTVAEAVQLHDAGLSIALVWETTARRALSGWAGGTVDAGSANAAAERLGYPRAGVLFFAVDFDAAWADVEPYATAAAKASERPAGVYGSARIVKAALAAGVQYGWQASAWSGSEVVDAAHVYQRRTSRLGVPAGCDENEIRRWIPRWGKAGIVPQMVELGQNLTSGRPALGCPHMAQWLPVFTRLCQARGYVRERLDIVQAYGDSSKSGGTHREGTAIDTVQASNALAADAREAGARASWPRGHLWGQSAFAVHTHIGLDCECWSGADYQIAAADAGFDGLGAGGRGGRDYIQAPSARRDWRAGIAWMRAKIADLEEDMGVSAEDIGRIIGGTVWNDRMNTIAQDAAAARVKSDDVSTIVTDINVRQLPAMTVQQSAMEDKLQALVERVAALEAKVAPAEGTA